MDASDFTKSVADSLDKLTDILNVGRLIFYTTAGLIVVLPVTMCLRLLTKADPLPYWAQFVSDLAGSGKHVTVWLAGLVMGFILATFVSAIVMVRFTRVPSGEIVTDHYTFQYPRLYSGGVRLPGTTSKDYAAWLISEYYRYVEIAVLVPYAALISLPVYALYSLAYLIECAGRGRGFVLDASHVAFAAWMFASFLAWFVIWPKFWFPRVAQSTYANWVRARRDAILGLADFIKETEKSASPAAAQSTGAQTGDAAVSKG